MSAVLSRVCPRCGDATAAATCCGFNLAAHRHWRMTADTIRAVHVLKARKGLDEETYRLRLGAVGVASCKDLTLAKFNAFMHGLSALPDAPSWRARAQVAGSTTRRARG